MSTRREVQELVYSMITENTGASILDSGGAYGRHHERNSKRSLEDFIKSPECTLTIENWQGNIQFDCTISVFHYMVESLGLDDICKSFNNMSVENWDSNEFYGVSKEGEEFFLSQFEVEGDTWNTYNHESNLSQILQGCELVHNDTGRHYILVQAHNGCDARGGYTDAKLFVKDCEYFLAENCLFESVDVIGGEVVCHEQGDRINEKDIDSLKRKYKLNKDGSKITLQGDLLIGL